METVLRVTRLRPDATLPTRGSDGAAGLDLYAAEAVTLLVGIGPLRVFTGVAVEVPPGHVGLIRDRSGMALSGFVVVGGVIDPDYRGEVAVMLHLISGAGEGPKMIGAGDRVAQLLVVPCPAWSVVEADALAGTARGDRGFGSTGR